MSSFGQLLSNGVPPTAPRRATSLIKILTLTRIAWMQLLFLSSFAVLRCEAEWFGSNGPAGVGAATSDDALNMNLGNSLPSGVYETPLASPGGSMPGPAAAAAVQWDNSVDLDEDFRLLWTVHNQDVTFEIQARTLGYVGVGFSTDGNPSGSDMAIGWIARGHTFFQDRYVKSGDGDLEPIVDPSQDYILIFGYENATHTVLRFSRKLDTCDDAHDIAITNGTMRVMYMYNDEDPPSGFVTPSYLPQPNESWHSARSLIIAQSRVPPTDTSNAVDLRNEGVEMPYGDDTLFWCKMFKLDKYKRKHHLVKYEPIFDSSWSIHYLQQLTLYECQGKGFNLEEMSRHKGRACMAGVRSIPLACNTIVVSWSKGTNGFVFPEEAGYPLESSQAIYYLMETHYSNTQANANQLQTRLILDNSGIRLHLTDRLRKYDAGVLSIGIDPNWRHIIPPGQKRVVSVGQCIEECTSYAFPPTGIDVFAVMMMTHRIGKEVKLRQIRQSEELPPIAHDNNVDVEYRDYRRLRHPFRSMPGDRLMVECIYDSSLRSAITLGGLSMKEESCRVIALYYPRQQKLTTCHSLPSLPTVLNSLGIEQLATNSNPVVISAPPELTGMTLEDRLLSYDWQNQFERFQQVTLEGTFKPLCWNSHNEIISVSKHITGHRANISKSFASPLRCKPKRVLNSESITQLNGPVVGHDLLGNNLTENGSSSPSSSSSSSSASSSSASSSSSSSTRSSRSSIIETLALSGAADHKTNHRSYFLLASSAAAVILIVALRPLRHQAADGGHPYGV